VGCGTSGIVELIAPVVAEVTAVDISATALKVSQGRSSCSNVRWLKADVRDMRALFNDDSFDLVLDKGTYAALECVSINEAAQGFSEAHRVLKPRGLLITFLLGYPNPMLLEQLAVLQIRFKVIARYDTGESEAAAAMAFAVRRLAKDDSSKPLRYGNGELSWYRDQDKYDA
jgi:ubiquinone/menaquinone biosynthesis C-methylase UbiE